ncbi:MAG: hypothetical protein GY842_01175 [bacterium]|nr:hypothetical protein [bacterium]
MNRRSLVSLMIVAASCGGLRSASAQAPEEVALDAVRTRSAVAQNDPAIDNWITLQLNRLRSAVQLADRKGDDAFIQAFGTQYNHAENSPAFKERFIERTDRRFAEEFSKGRGLEAVVGLALARVLGVLQHLGTTEALSAGMATPGQPAVRYVCAKTLAELRPEIEKDPGRTQAIIQRLRDWGAQEPNGVVLKQVYGALSYRGAHLEAANNAILDVIKGQLRLREQGAPACDGAEEAAYGFLQSELGNLQNTELLVAVLAAQLRMEVRRYLTKGLTEEERYLIELTIEAGEGLLARVVSSGVGGPKVREALKNAEDRDINLVLELNKWIGTEQTAGVLNAAPWNVLAGAPIPD